MAKKIILGAKLNKEPNVRIGVRPARPLAQAVLKVGPGATLRSGTVLYLGSTIGAKLSTGHNAIIREENTIGDNFCLWSQSVVDYGCRIGHRVKIHSNCYIAQYTEIEDDVFLAPGVIIANDPHPGGEEEASCMKGPRILKGAQIGANVTLLAHITIGQHSLVGAGAVVTKDVPPYSVVYGNPARVKGPIQALHCRIKNHFPYRNKLKL
jgi:acetyltransferase-like isoleucine patch superfamily enzyme